MPIADVHEFVIELASLLSLPASLPPFLYLSLSFSYLRNSFGSTRFRLRSTFLGKSI